MLFAVLLGGLRTGSIVGLQIRSDIPRELGGALIAFILIFVATNRIVDLDGHNENKPASEIVPP